MNSMKKIFAVLLAMVVMVPSVVVSAAPASSTKVNVKDIKVVVKNREYTGELEATPHTIQYNGQTLKEGVDYKIGGIEHKNVGTYTVTIKGLGNFAGTITYTYEIKKAKNDVPMEQEKSVAGKYRKNKLTTNKTVATEKGNGAITSWKVVGLKNPKNAKYVSVDKKTGKVTIKKGAPKNGVFKIQIKYAGDKSHYGRTTTVKVSVK